MTGQDKQQSGELLQYVKGSLRQQGYWRRRPWIYDLPPLNRRKTNAAFGRIAHDHGRNKFGTVEIVNKEGARVQIPASALPIMERVKPLAPAAPREIPTVSRVEQLKRMQEILAQLTT